MTTVDVTTLSAKLTTVATALEEHAEVTDLSPGLSVALKLVREALGMLERAHAAGIKPDVATAASALACWITCLDVDGKPLHGLPTNPAGVVSKTVASLETFAAAIVEAAVQASVLAAPRVRACSRCDHLLEDRLKFLDEIEGIRMENAALRGRLEATRCACGGSRPPEVLTADLLPSVSPCRCTQSDVHTACVGHCPESAERARANVERLRAAKEAREAAKARSEGGSR